MKTNSKRATLKSCLDFSTVVKFLDQGLEWEHSPSIIWMGMRQKVGVLLRVSWLLLLGTTLAFRTGRCFYCLQLFLENQSGISCTKVFTETSPDCSKKPYIPWTSHLISFSYFMSMKKIKANLFMYTRSIKDWASREKRCQLVKCLPHNWAGLS